MNGRAPAIIDHLASLADSTRSRLLLLLDRNELTVSELCSITQLPQSTVSRHLKALVDGGWISSRAEATSRLYAMTRDDLDAGTAAALAAGAGAGRADAGGGAGSTASSGGAGRAAHHVAGVLLVLGRPVGSPARRAVRRSVSTGGICRAGRRRRGRSAISAAAPDKSSAALAPFVAHVVAVDASAPMLQAAKTPAAAVHQRRPPPRRARGAADRRRAARCGHADARAAPRARSGAGPGRGARECSSPEGG